MLQKNVKGCDTQKVFWAGMPILLILPKGISSMSSELHYRYNKWVSYCSEFHSSVAKFEYAFYLI